MAHGQLIYTSTDACGKLVALLDERRKTVKRHALTRKKPSRSQGTLAEKLAFDRSQKAERAALNAQIDALMAETNDRQLCGEDHSGSVPLACETGDGE
jgi:hypothetical protein